MGNRFTLRFKKMPNLGMCNTCRNLICAVLDNGGMYARCAAFHRRLHGPVAECTEFYETSRVPLETMEKIAWTVESKGGRSIGFKKPSKEKLPELSDTYDDYEC